MIDDFESYIFWSFEVIEVFYSCKLFISYNRLDKLYTTKVIL